MIQGENKQDFYDANHPQEIIKRELQKKAKTKRLVTRGYTPEQFKREFIRPRQITERSIPLNKLQTDAKQRAELAKIKADTYKLEHPTRYKLQKYGETASQKLGTGVASIASKVFSNIKSYVVKGSQQAATYGRQQQSLDTKRINAYIKLQRQRAIAKQKAMLRQRVQQSRQQPQQPNRIQQHSQMLRNQYILRQRQQAEAQRQLEKATTYGFYQPDAETTNPFGLRSRYKINFGQNVYTEKDPANHVVKMNGKYKWRAD